MTIKGIVIVVSLFVFGWVTILAGITLFTDDAPAALVMFPSQDFLEQMPEDAAVLSATSFTVTLASDDTDLARRLYQKGAWLVLPAGLRGCFSRS